MNNQYLSNDEAAAINDLLPGNQIWGIGSKLQAALSLGAGLKNGKKIYADASAGNDDKDGLSWETAYRTLQKAVNVTAANDGSVIFTNGFFDETVTITRSHNGLCIVGMGNRGASGIAVSAAGAEGLFVRADDVTLINFGVAANTTGDYAVKVTGDRFRAYGCKFEGADTSGKCVHMKCGTIAERAAGTDRSAADALFSDCEFAWGYDGIHFQSSDYGSVTECAIINCRFHNISHHEISETDTGGAGAVQSLLVKGCVLAAAEDGTAPTLFVHLDAASDHGLITGCVFEYATNEADVIKIAAGVLYVANMTEAGITAARPS